MKKTPEGRNSEICKSREEGAGIEELAEKYKLSVVRIRQILRSSK